MSFFRRVRQSRRKHGNRIDAGGSVPTADEKQKPTEEYSHDGGYYEERLRGKKYESGNHKESGGIGWLLAGGFCDTAKREPEVGQQLS